MGYRTFSEMEYSYDLSINEVDNRRNVTVLVLKNGEKFDKYTFVGTKEPVERVIF